MHEFIPFDDCWFDDQLPGRLVPLPSNCECLRDIEGVFHWVREDDNPAMLITSPLCAPMRAAMPALSSST